MYTVHAVDLAGNEGARSPGVNVRASTPPTVLDAGVTPLSGPSTQPFTFFAIVRDPDGDQPASVTVEVDGEPYLMVLREARPDGTLRYERALLLAPLQLGVPAHSYRFVIDAPEGTSAFPSTEAVLNGPLALSGPDAARGGSIQARLPVPVLPPLAALAAVAALALARRRWSS